jgi:hypothetical protein
MSEATRAASRRYYQKNKEAEKIRSKKWRQDNPEKYKEWAEKNKEKRRAASRRYEYNITPEEYERKKAEQGNKCAICRQETNLLVVDHNHLCCPSRKSRAGYKTCGRCNRGLLCRSCNTAIGLFKESEQVLSSAIQYLKGYQQ